MAGPGKHPFFHRVYQGPGSTWLAAMAGACEVFYTAEAAARAVDEYCAFQGLPCLNFQGEGMLLCADVAAAGDAYIQQLG